MWQCAEVQLKIYPNPSNGVFTLQFPVQTNEETLEIYDITGKVVHRDYIAPWSQFKKMEVNVPDGVNMCRVRWKERDAKVNFVIR